MPQYILARWSAPLQLRIPTWTIPRHNRIRFGNRNCQLSNVNRNYSSTVAARVPLRLMPLGGSITHGVGSSDGNGYRKFLYEALESRGFQPTMLGSRKTGTMGSNSHEGWRGFKIHEIQEKGIKSAKLRLPNLFTINSGSNDCIQDFEIGTSGKRIDDMLHRLWEVSPGSTIVLSTLVKNNDEQVNTRVVEINHQIRKLVQRREAEQKRIVLADMYALCGPQVHDLIDGVHPNDTGYKKMADIWYNSIEIAALKGLL
ncbi:SGNH hydrolase-type esterase domain-containing protein [Xylaria cf. heliscus]|nr:SGNH hydrolase-type esterase domain-containing protein [Xylaria cf. heliscus]